MAIWGVGVMVGPIVGPTLGGYLTDIYSWRWVFYINLPVGILALLGIIAFVPETKLDKTRNFDFFGFGLLSLAIAALQLTLDRGSSLDWFGSTEIIVEAVLAGLGLYMFLVHMFTAKRPFIEPGLFKDRNFATGMVFMFALSVVLLASMALLPPFLQGLMGYPVIATGVVLAPRGLGTMMSMFFAGRLMQKMQPRFMIIGGLILIAWSLWVMSGFTAEVSEATIMWTGFVQGLGFGFCFVPLTAVSFVTLPPHYRTDGTGMFSLVRNVGTSMGVSIVTSLLAANIQEVHASLADRLTPFRDALAPSALPHFWNWTTTQGAAAFDMAVTRQAVTIAYLNDFLFMMAVTLAALPLAFLLKMPPKTASARPEPIVVE
jgi:DHA2 family multidrug resistance protein